MKNLLLFVLGFPLILGAEAQIMSPEEKAALIRELKKEIIDSLKQESTNNTTIDSAQKAKLELNGYIETYYLFDLNNPQEHARPAFIYSHNRHNEFNINLALIQLQYTSTRVRANLGFMAGTYSNANLAAEPGVLKNIYEAHVGLRLSKKKQLWVNAGIFGSHIGFESAIGKDCWTMTRSILADNSPYFETGLKFSYTSTNNKWLASVLVLNGWQRIQALAGNSLPAFGWQLQYRANDDFLINSSSFMGSISPDSSRKMRYFHNLYAIFSPKPKLGLILGFDIGLQQKNAYSSAYSMWFSPVWIVRYRFSEKITLTGRLEYYSDEDNVLINTGTNAGFAVLGYSANVDFNPVPFATLRIEARLLQSTQIARFQKRDGSPTFFYPSLGASVCIAVNSLLYEKR